MFVAYQMIFLVSLNSFAQGELSKADRDKAIENLKNSQVELLKATKGLSEAQLNFKATPESWSVAECVEHLAVSENGFSAMVQGSLQAEADPSRRGQLQFNDEDIMNLIRNRTEKVKTQEQLEPKNNFGSYQGSLDQFKSKRKEHINYVKTTTDDLRNHFFDFPFGTVDSYQVFLFMSGHTERHTAQIKEVLANSEFPRS